MNGPGPLGHAHSAFFFVTVSSAALITNLSRRTPGSAIRAGNTYNHTDPAHQVKVREPHGVAIASACCSG